MVNSSWFADGGLNTYSAASASPQQDQTKFIGIGGTHTAAVDTNAITRVQYLLTAALSEFSNLYGTARIRVSWDDWAAAVLDGGKDITAELYFMPSWRYTGTGTPSVGEIMLGAYWEGLVFRSNDWVSDIPWGITGGTRDRTFLVPGPTSTMLSANTKYWVALVPVKAVKGSPPGNSAPLLTAPNYDLGRGISVWTNRTPKAPVITSPISGSVVASSTSLTLTFANNDPDGVVGGTSPAYTDISGVQVQYAPRPSSTNPTPVWSDLPFASSTGALRKGWWIEDSIYNTAGESLELLRDNLSIQIRCGSSTPVADQGLLPAGSWQIRMRTFDFGHQLPNALRPLNSTTGNYTADTFPGVNVSPWSAPVIVTVTAQVPPPIPVSPINSAAVVEGPPVVLTWQYRNTAVPPFDQAKRSVQIRRVGDSIYTSLVTDQPSSSTTLTVDENVFALVSGNAYQWRVRVTDADNSISDWSESATFWMVPSPSSGDVRPVPSGTIDGATLGCGTHRVFVYRKGGKTRVGELTGCTYVEWNRLRDDISLAKIVVMDWGVDCGNLLALLEPWAYEIVIMRDNGYSQDRVWEGPITLLTYEVDAVTIQAKDVMAFAYRRIIKQKMSDVGAGDTVTSRAARVLQNVFAPDDPNILSYLVVLTKTDDAREYRSTPAYSRTAYEEIDDMAANAGLDYTTVGRSILLWGTKHRIGTLPEFRDEDLGAPPIVSVYGMSMANRYVVSDGNGIWGEATRLNAEGKDESYGLIEMLSSSWASDSASDQGTYTQEGIQKITQSFADAAERSIGDRYPAPVVVRVPDNTSLNPGTVLSIQQLVPGVLIPLRSTGTLRNVVASQKLDAVKVVEQGGKETITITMSPFSRDDTNVDPEE